MMGVRGVDDDNYDDDILDNAEKFIVCRHKIKPFEYPMLDFPEC